MKKLDEKPNDRIDAVSKRIAVNKHADVLSIANTKNGKVFNRREFFKASATISTALGLTNIGLGCGGSKNSNGEGTNYDIHVDEEYKKRITYQPSHVHSRISDVKISPDGTKVASKVSAIKVWNLFNGHLICKFEDAADVGTSSMIGSYSLCWSPDGEKIASVTGKIWNFYNESLILNLEGSAQSTILSIAWSPDGKKIAAGMTSGDIIIWNAENANILLKIQKGEGEGSGTYFGVKENAINSPTNSGHTTSVWSVDWSPDGTKLVSGSRDKTIKIWNATGGDCLLSINSPDYMAFHTTNWSPDGNKIVCGRENGYIDVFDANSGESQLSINVSDRGCVHIAKWSSDGTRLLVACVARGEKEKPIQVYNNQGEKLFQLFGMSDACFAADWSPDSTIIVSGGRTVIAWSVLDKKYLHHMEDPDLDKEEVLVDASTPENLIILCSCNLVCTCDSECGVEVCTCVPVCTCDLVSY